MAKTYYYYKDSILGVLYKEEEELNVNENPNLESITKAEYDTRIAIAQHKAYLRSTDYVVIKLAEAETNEEQNAIRQEYADVIAERKRVRGLVNELEEGL